MFNRSSMLVLMPAAAMARTRQSREMSVAVSTHSDGKSCDVANNIMTMNAIKNAGIKGGWISLSTNLKKGEKVRLLAGKDQDKICEVLEVKDGSFRVALETA